MALAEVRPIRAARPGIVVDGQNRPQLSGGLVSLSVMETSDGLYRCEAEFGNWGASSGGVGHLYFDRQLLDFGKSVEIKIGQDTVFRGSISALEGRFPEGAPPRIVVLAEDRLQDLRMTRRTRSFENVSDSDVFTQIANDHGLQAGIDLRGPTYKVLAQVNQSDLAFLRDRARAIGAEVWMEDRSLKAALRSSRRGAPVRLAYGAKLKEFSVLADLAHQRTGVTVSGWDVSAKSSIKEDAAESAISSELDGGSSGASILSSAFGDRKDCVAHTVPHTNDEAQFLAEGHFRAIARRFLVGRGLAEPDATLRVGVTVDLAGLGPLFNGKYYLAEVRHLFDTNRGMRTEFTAERPGLGKP